ncbi:hypothetical protein J1N35_005104 [Gossypium stocksii]|uniref:Uncharacterized protein n=1 Tax=Gossypium stocksii TaxID=47602 RepID=A0A9D3WD65_9ROSI|nr:hypothetical protein J1N35_005104 [Gossypium stocksii]
MPGEEARGRQPHTRRPRWVPRHQTFGRATEANPLPTPTQEQTLMVAPPPVSFVYGPSSLAYNTQMPLTFQMMMTYRPSMFGVLTGSLIIISPVYETQYSHTYTPTVSKTPSGSLFCEAGSFSQPPILRLEDTRWKSRSNRSQSITDEDEEDERLRP